MHEDLLLQLLQRGARFEPELVERAAGASVGVERLCLAVGAVQREHELSAEPLAGRVLRDQRFQLADQVCFATEREVGFDALFDRGEPEVLETAAFDLRERLVELGERTAAPERERLTQQARRMLRMGIARLGDQRFEAPQVDRRRLGREEITRWACLQRRVRQQLAQPRHVDLHRRHRGLGRRVAPQVVDQSFAGDDTVRVVQQERKQRTLLRASERKWPLVVQDLQRSEDSIVHRPPCAPILRPSSSHNASAGHTAATVARLSAASGCSRAATQRRRGPGTGRASPHPPECHLVKVPLERGGGCA